MRNNRNAIFTLLNLPFISLIYIIVLSSALTALRALEPWLPVFSFPLSPFSFPRTCHSDVRKNLKYVSRMCHIDRMGDISYKSFVNLKVQSSQATLIRVVIAIENKFSLTRLHEL